MRTSRISNDESFDLVRQTIERQSKLAISPSQCVRVQIGGLKLNGVRAQIKKLSLCKMVQKRQIQVDSSELNCSQQQQIKL